MKEKAAAIGAKIRSEDGVHAAIRAIYIYLDVSIFSIQGFLLAHEVSRSKYASRDRTLLA